MANLLLERAAHTRPAVSARGALERIFAFMFKGFVYNQIWEDPAIDLEALAIEPHHSLITIASGGCNVLNDLNREAFDEMLSNRLDETTRRHWSERVPLRGRRIDMFARNLYRHGLLGRFIGILHVIAKMNGKNLEEILAAKTLEEQRQAFDRIVVPILENKAIQLLSKSPVSLYALGIPPAQYDELVAGSQANPIDILRKRIEKLACDFPVNDNYFAWQAFSRGYDTRNKQAVPPYLDRTIYDVIRRRTERVEVHHASLIDFLRTQPAQSLHRFVLLDAQDWMTPTVLQELWTEIDRTAVSTDARVIFRTAGEDSPLSRKLPAALLAPWIYREDQSRILHARDRSSIYGGFHIYERRPLS